MKQLEGIQNSLPDDIALKIASSLQVSDVCSLGSCSRFWRELCGSDCVWASLYRERWPALDFAKIKNPQIESALMGWRGIYLRKHNEMASRATVVVHFMIQCLSAESIEVVHYLSAIENLCSMQFGFKDVQMFFFSPKLNVVLNLVGLHYCISWLGVPAEYIMEALNSCKISEREVCVRWWKLGRWFNGFRLRDESHSRTFSLADIAMAKEDAVLGVLHRGAIHEVLRVQISVAKPVCTPWSFQSSPTQN
ncbi:F-box only protein [Actinidia chinensis var. chinensis]|uniref:F-box only protein n=1 Tax=Actinidia chinensis var. chinensis TaxID=1590841 RepID=A0A2R6PJY5_ACTCC|nr:F-box only protein [Actinidia chinensis var. chinensis]